MDALTTEKVMRVFEACVLLEPQQRQDFIDSECSQDEEMRRYLEALLEDTQHVDRNTLLKDGGLRAFIDGLASDDFAPGSALGRYRILSEISRGGMGVVFLAERSDGQGTGRVAIKIIKRGMDTDAILESFDRERAILATLKSHPNIVHLEDADVTEEGSPYFVMEFIDGSPLDKFSANTPLGIDKKLELFLKVCGAVAFAHQRTIIHRDLKPGNVLVTPGGEPKLLDFGISKLVTPTEQGASVSLVNALRIMTLEYASPEQVKGEELDVRTDVYSLGVILYRLLTGVAPYDLASKPLSVKERIVCEVDPVAPSVALPLSGKASTKESRSLKGNLDTIVLKALRKDPDRRYSSVEQFSQDIRRHMENLPVVARPDTWRYRTGQFVRRHRAGVITGASFLVLVLCAIVLVAWQAHVAIVQRTRAEARFKDVERLADWMLFDFHDSIEKLPGSTEPRRQLIQHAMTYLDSLASESGGDPTLERNLAMSYSKLGDIIGDPRDINQGDIAAALASYKKSLEILDRIQARDPQDPLVLRNIAIAQERIGGVNEVTGNLTAALDYERKSAATFEKLSRVAPTLLNRRGVPVSHSELGQVLLMMGKPKDALLEFEQGFPLLQQLYNENPNNPQLKRDISVYYSKFGDAYEASGELSRSLESYQKGLTVREELHAAHSTNREASRDVGTSADRISTVLTELKRYPEAITYERQSLDIALEQSASDHADVQAVQDAADCYIGIAQLQFETAHYPEALASANQSLELRQRLVGGNPSNIVLKAAIADTYVLQSNTETKMHRGADALRLSRVGLEMAENAHKADTTDARFSEVLARAYFQAAIATESAQTGVSGRLEALRLYKLSHQAFVDLKQVGDLNEEDSQFLTASDGAVKRLERSTL
jgi:tetratricopeptide (TPR) repeat protein/predicted Ser/Thr protein kinase